jgi:hypothetical protein
VRSVDKSSERQTFAQALCWMDTFRADIILAFSLYIVFRIHPACSQSIWKDHNTAFESREVIPRQAQFSLSVSN